ncbi:MAG: fibronectin type III domain-containing protein [Candidatus Schekmanbacteria bacterium]|nr:fibronectin type III domain-containing protein [Candidatus Schekmanbacteria bacterium]
MQTQGRFLPLGQLRNHLCTATLGTIVATCSLLWAPGATPAWTPEDELPEPNYSDNLEAVTLRDGESEAVQEIKNPTLGHPAILSAGQELHVVLDLDLDPAVTALSVARVALSEHLSPVPVEIDLTASSTAGEDDENDLFTISATLPTSDLPLGVFDLQVSGSAGGQLFEDTQIRAVRIDTGERSSFRFVHLSDVHQGDPRGTDDGTYPQEVVDGIIKTINFLQPAFVVVSGDLAFGSAYEDEYPDAFHTFEAADFATYVVPGNHDMEHKVAFVSLKDGADYYPRFYGPTYFSFDYGKFHFVGLNSMDRPQSDREIGFDLDGIKAEYWGGIQLDIGNQLEWVEQDLQALSGEETVLLYMHHDPAKDVTTNYEQHDQWEYGIEEYRSSAEIIHDLIQRFGVSWILLGHDHYDEVRDAWGAKFVLTTTAGSSRRFGSHWGFRVFDVIADKIASYTYNGDSQLSQPYGYDAARSGRAVDVVPYIDYSYGAYANDGSEPFVAAIVKNLLAEPVTGTLKFLVKADSVQASGGTIVQDLALDGGIHRVLVEVPVPANTLSAIVTVTDATAAPPAPSELDAVAHSSSLELSWKGVGVSDIAGYNVYYDTDGSGEPYAGTGAVQGSSPVFVPAASLADPGYPTFTLSGLTSGQTYYLAVSAVDQTSEGALSTEVQRAPHTPPDTPENFWARGANGQIALTWDAVADAAGYRVYYDSDAAGPPYRGVDATQGSSPVDAGTSTQLVLAGLRNGATYYVTVRAYDSSGGASNDAPERTVIPQQSASGDVDDSGATDSYDASLLARSLVHLATIKGKLLDNADANGNDRIDVGDAVALQQLVAPPLDTAPIATFASTPPYVQTADPTAFDAAGSYDREEPANTLMFRWDFEGTGSFTAWSSSPQATHTFAEVGLHNVVLEVRDSSGKIGRYVQPLLPKYAQHLFIIDIDGVRRDVMYNWIANRQHEDGSNTLRDDIIGNVVFSGTNDDPADFSSSMAIGVDRSRAVFPSVTFVNQAILPLGVHPHLSGIAGNEMMDRDDLFDRAFVGIDAQQVYVSSLALNDLYSFPRSIYEYAADHGYRSSVIFHQYPKGANRWVTPTNPSEFLMFLLDPAQDYDTASFYRGMQEVVSNGLPEVFYLYLAGLDHRSHAEGITSQPIHMEFLDTLFDILINGGTINYPGGKEDPIPFAGLAHMPDSTTSDPDDTLYDNTVFAFSPDHGQVNIGDDPVDRTELEAVIEEALGEDIVIASSPSRGLYARELYDQADNKLDVLTALAGIRDVERRSTAFRRTSSEDFENAGGSIEFNGDSCYIYIRNRTTNDWSDYPDFTQDILPVAKALRRNTDDSDKPIEQGAIRYILVRKTALRDGRYESEGYYVYTGDGTTNEISDPAAVFSSEQIRDLNIATHLENLDDHRSGDIILSGGKPSSDEDPSGWFFGNPLFTSTGEHGNMLPGETLIPHLWGGKPIQRNGLARTVSADSQVDFAPTGAQFLGIHMRTAQGSGHLFEVAQAGLAATLAASDAVAEAGETATVSLTVSGAEAIAGLRCSLTYDPASVQLASLTTASPAASWEVYSKSMTGRVDIVGVSAQALASTTATVLEARFTVLAEAAMGTEVPIQVQSCTFSDESGNPGAGSGIDGSITVGTPAEVPAMGVVPGLLAAAAGLASVYHVARRHRRRKVDTAA